jgi:hypothetical protein
MRYRFSLFLAFLISLLSYTYGSGQQLYSIPKQTIDPIKILGPKSTEFRYSDNKTPKSLNLDMNAFDISSLVTYGEYKEYLKGIKKDSSAKFYLSQMPDSSMCVKESYEEYITSNTYDSFPVLGISWEAAMNYCRWKTIQNKKDSIQYIYRLPCESEWLEAYCYLNTDSFKNDFSQNYSDWLLNAYYEDVMDYIKSNISNHWANFDYIYFAKKSEPPVLKRKCVIGDSYLFKLETLADYGEMYYYSFEGYRQVGFRFVKEIVDTTNIIDEKGKQNPSIDLQILKMWGLK